jgi:HEAT repeat protein
MSGEERPTGPISPPEAGGRSDTSVVTQYFLLPLAVVAGLVGVFLLFTMATRRPPTARDHLNTLRSGRFNQRWQAAFELSNLLREGKGLQEDPAFVPDLIREFRKSASDPDEDPRVRRYLILALGNSESKAAVPPLLQAARGQDAEGRLFSLWGLARLRAPEAAPLFKAGLESPDPSVRSVSAYGLGVLPPVSGADDLKAALKDPVAEVRWNAALALGRNGDPSGSAILLQLLDREYLGRQPSMEAAERTDTMLNAMRALKYLKINGLENRMRRLADSDPDARVRQAAQAWLSEGRN